MKRFWIILIVAVVALAALVHFCLVGAIALGGAAAPPKAMAPTRPPPSHVATFKN